MAKEKKKAPSVEAMQAEKLKLDSELDQAFLKEYNALVKKYGRQLGAALQLVRSQPKV